MGFWQGMYVYVYQESCMQYKLLVQKTKDSIALHISLVIEEKNKKKSEKKNKNCPWKTMYFCTPFLVYNKRLSSA